MQRMLSVLTVLALGLALVAFLLAGGEHSAPEAMNRASVRGTSITLDFVSFALGFAAALAAVWVHRVPWGSLPARMRVWIAGWRANATLLGLAVTLAAIVLFY